MVHIVFEKKIPVPAEKVWALLADFGNISWSGMTNVEVEGEGVGMIRRIIVGEGRSAVERLEAFDPENMSFVYSIETGNQLPIDDFRGNPKVSVVDENHCSLSWTVTGVEKGVSEQEMEAMLARIYPGLLDTISDAVLARE